MANAITREHMIDYMVQLAKDVCEQEGVVYEEFIADLAQALGEEVEAARPLWPNT